jgi:hypothetical protein
MCISIATDGTGQPRKIGPKENNWVYNFDRAGFKMEIPGKIPQTPPETGSAWKLPTQLLVPLLLAIFVELVILPQVPESARYRHLVDHLTIALMIASILGLTYEFFLSKRRDEVIQQLMQFQYTSFHTIVVDVAQQYAFASPDVILDLLRDVAIQTKQVPTLYRISRHKDNEYTFAANTEYFDRLVAVRREGICERLREWVRPDSPVNLKFLASDFVGKYQLLELAQELREEFDIQRDSLRKITDEKDKSWILNYLWAYSRCEMPRYKSLEDFLCNEADEWAQKWILFVPRQMPDPEFVAIIERYLASPHATAQIDLEAVKSALSALQTAGYRDAKLMLDKLPGRFQGQALGNENQFVFTGKPVQRADRRRSQRRRDQAHL